MAEKIEFVAEVVRVKTMADGGLRFELGVGEQYIMQAAQLMECKRFGAVLQVTAEAVAQESLRDLEDETEKGAEGSGSSVDRRRTKNRRDQRSGG
jgi:hypothetical protein